MSDSTDDRLDLHRLALDLAPAGFLAVDEEGRIVLVNRETERLFGYAREDLIGRPVEMLLPEDAAARHPGLRRWFLSDPSTRPMGAGRELSARRRDGTQVPVEIGLNPLRTTHGTFVLAAIVDVSERRAHERRLRESEDQRRQAQKLESLGTLASGVAHDLNNVLMAVAGYTEMALREPLEPGVRHDLEQVAQAGERGRQLIRRILAYSRKSDPKLHPIRVAAVIEESLELLRRSLPSSVEIRTRIARDAPRVMGDEVEIHQVLMNLAGNAAQAMGPDGGVLAVELEGVELDAATAGAAGLEPGRYARLTVADDGPGMTEEVRRRAFEPFFTTKPVGEGTGLGLSVVHGIARARGGAVGIDSAPGAGTRIVLHLPATETREETAPAAPAEAALGPARVLLVDDEVTLASLLRRRLESFGLRVTVHTASPAALEDFRARPDDFDLVITDNTMPKLTGVALARELHRLRPALPILMISGIGDAMAPTELREIGVRRVLPKPHTGAELIAALHEVLARG